MSDRRTAQRIPVSFRVSCGATSLGRKEGTISDLTMTGCRLETSAPVPVNTYLELWIQLSATAPRILVELAAVRWVLDGRCGIEFLSLRPEHEAELERLIEGKRLMGKTD